MNENGLTYHKVGHTGYITFSQNFETGTLAALAEICVSINGDEDLYVVIINSSDEFFWQTSWKEYSSETELLPLSPAMAISSINRPTIAVLNGDTLGPGLEIALACDLRIAVDTARFGLPQIQKGQIPSDGGTQRLARLVGKGKALEMVLTGDTIDASQALEIGLINRVVKAEDLNSEVEAITATLLTKAPLAARYCKEAVIKGLDMTLDQGLRLEADLYFLLHTTSDRTEGVQSYLQKRKPEYKGK